MLPVLETERLILRLAHLEDVHEIVRYYKMNRSHLEPFEPARPEEFYAAGYWNNKVRMFIEEFKTDNALKLFIFKKELPATIIGSVNYSVFVRGAFHSCNLGFSLAKEAQGHSYMYEALSHSIKYIFQNLNLHRIAANYMPANQRSANLLHKLGFEKEGFAKNYLRINGNWEDHILTSLINPNWAESE